MALWNVSSKNCAPHGCARLLLLEKWIHSSGLVRDETGHSQGTRADQRYVVIVGKQSAWSKGNFNFYRLGSEGNRLGPIRGRFPQVQEVEKLGEEEEEEEQQEQQGEMTTTTKKLPHVKCTLECVVKWHLGKCWSLCFWWRLGDRETVVGHCLKQTVNSLYSLESQAASLIPGAS